MKPGRKTSLSWGDISVYKNELYGFSILWIMIFHGITNLNLDYSMGIPWLYPLHRLISFGNIGCEIFLFCSGICLYFSYFRNPDLLSFISKRLTRVFLPVLIISGWYWGWVWIIKEHDWAKFFQKLSMMDFWVSGDQQIWFISFIIVCYFLYPYFYVFLFESKFSNAGIRLCCLLGATIVITLSMRNVYPEIYNRVEIGLTRMPVFLLGCFCGKFVYEKKTMPKLSWFCMLIADSIALFVLCENILSGVWKRWFFLVGGIALTFTLILILKMLDCNWIQKTLQFFGKISLNLYISHILVIRLYKLTPWYANCRILHYLVILLISVFVGWITEQIITFTLKPRRN